MEEIWKDIEGYEGIYQVSDLARVRSIDREIMCGDNIRKFKGRILKTYITGGDTYEAIKLFYEGEKEHKYIHSLVAEAFILNPENKRCVNHKNGIKTDNRIDNLEWNTHSENNQHAYATGLHKRTPKKLSETSVKAIRQAIASGDSHSTIGKTFGINGSTVSLIRNNKIWVQ